MSVVAEPTTKERPILFSGEMIKAILDGRKTQTRRVCKLAYHLNEWADAAHTAVDGMPVFWWGPQSNEQAGLTLQAYATGARCPYGQPGDHLWVRETFAVVHGSPEHSAAHPSDLVLYRADDGDAEDAITNARAWRPSIFMPRAYSRITLEITGIRVQRVRSISGDDALREGVTMPQMANGAADPTVEFIALWDSINEPRGYGWAVNPWVWVVEFKQVPA